MTVRRSRQQARDLRTGRAWASRAAEHPGQPSPSTQPSYASLIMRLGELRTALASDRPNHRPLHELRRDHADLDRVLATAMAHAFTADAQGAPTPDGIVSWAAEGLARSYERELAMLAAMDICGLAQPTISGTS